MDRVQKYYQSGKGKKSPTYYLQEKMKPCDPMDYAYGFTYLTV